MGGQNLKGVHAMKPRILPAILGLILVSGLSCSKCEKRGTATIAGLIPGDVAGVLVFPDLSKTITDTGSSLLARWPRSSARGR
jgi:hypothetical protein